VTWHRGILIKGPGLCHGITGNAYFLHSLYRATGDEIWLKRTQLMALLSFDESVKKIVASERMGRKVKGVPDRPFSLMEGIAGDIVFYSELISGDPRFPGYEI
jgi:hypothetical protein